MLPSKEALEHLQRRVREATGPDRELDCIIQAIFDGREIREEGCHILGRSTRPPHDECLIGTIDPGRHQRNFTEAWRKPKVPPFTTDPEGLGACVALLREVLPGCEWSRDANRRFSIWSDAEADDGEGVVGWLSDVDALANDCLTFIDAIISAKLSNEKEALSQIGEG